MQNLSVVGNLTNTDKSHRGSPKDVAAEAGDVSLGESGCNWNERTSKEEIVNLGVMQQSLPVMNSKGRSCEGLSESSFITSEPSGSWGDFEGFKEPADKSERLNHSLEVLVKSTEISGADPDPSSGGCSASAARLSAEPPLYEEIFKLSFPEVIVAQSRESIISLEQILDTNNEDAGIPELSKNQCRTLRDFDNTPSLRHPWSKSHCQENLLRVLGIDANQKDIPESQADIFEESNAKDNEHFGFDGFSVNDCKTLIQTKLSVSPGSSHGHLFSCNLFLKTSSSNENTQCITIPRKKQIFPTHNLKMKFFSSDVC
uniref:Clathrin binding box of aftiphilin containing 1 n=1 Tax=Malurus cyaneus samueli TaxID=2593467 RepID=A0A8C5TTJ7_9PASS